MLRIFRGRESVDKEKFIYDRVSGETFVIVPNQYTLVAEEQALKYTGKACLYDIEIISMNRLGRRILMEKGLENVPLLDKYGRFMLLSGIIRKRRSELGIFATAADKRIFVEMVNDYISDLKQQGCTTDDIEYPDEGGAAGELLADKLRELSLICGDYEKAIEGKYTDSEDLVSMYIDAIKDSRLIDGKNIWIYGYDSVTPKFIDAVTELAKRANEVSFLVNESDFALDKSLVSAITGAARDKRIDFYVEEIPDGYELEKSETIRLIEEKLFAREDYNSEDKDKVASGSIANCDPDFTSGADSKSVSAGITVTECANPYAEAENAAVFIHSLIRDEGYRLNDIVIIANDEEGMQPKVARTFEEYGLPVFVDARRGIGDTQAAALVVGLLEFVNRKYNTASMLMLLKSGLAGCDRERIEGLENYARIYGIKGSMWTSPFKYGRSDYDEETFAQIEGLRSDLMKRILPLKELTKKSERVSDFAKSFYAYLIDVWNIEEMVDKTAREQEEAGLPEEAQRTGQTFDALMNILAQIVEICGDEKLDMDEFMMLFIEGLESIEVGMIPPAVDGITMGTMIRTRTAPVKAVLILGANEGVLPMEPSPEGLFSADEKSYFAKKGFPLGELDEIKMLEENIALYRSMSKASEKVYISYSLSDGNGGDMRPSSLIDSVKTLFPELVKKKDLVGEGFGKDLVNDRRETLRHLINHLKERSTPQELLSHTILTWYEKEAPDLLAPVLEAALSDNSTAPLEPETARRLYAGIGKDYRFSASMLEKYDHCPFRHFVLYGLKPKEERSFSGDSRAIGDIYHECIMNVSRRLTVGAEGKRIFETLNESEVDRIVDEELYALSEMYKGGLFVSTEREKYRLDRALDVCRDVIRVIVEQLRTGDIEESFFEESFGVGRRFAPIEYGIDGQRIRIEGKIDRVDILRGGKVRIIDYKTGNDKLDIEQMRQGYKMQLMIYMEGTVSGDLEPAGMFYFNISDMDYGANDEKTAALDAKLQKEQEKRFSLKGAYIDEKEITEKMPLEVVDSRSIKLTREEFSELERDVRDSVERICGGIISGDIRIEPVKISPTESECRFCEYKPICRFDLSYSGNRYRRLK